VLQAALSAPVHSSESNSGECREQVKSWSVKAEVRVRRRSAIYPEPPLPTFGDSWTSASATFAQPAHTQDLWNTRPRTQPRNQPSRSQRKESRNRRSRRIKNSLSLFQRKILLYRRIIFFYISV